MNEDDLSALLLGALRLRFPNASAIGGLRRLSGGASQETWSFTLEEGDTALPLILRRVPGGVRSPTGSASIPLEAEAQVIRCAEAAGVPAPKIRAVLEPSDALGSAFVMDHVDGETIAKKF